MPAGAALAGEAALPLIEGAWAQMTRNSHDRLLPQWAGSLTLVVAGMFLAAAGCRERPTVTAEQPAPGQTTPDETAPAAPAAPEPAQPAPPQRERDRAAEWVSMGIQAGQRGDIEGAIQAFRKAVELRPDFAEARAQLGAALAMSGDRNAAITELQEAVRLNPDYLPGRVNLATALL